MDDAQSECFFRVPPAFFYFRGAHYRRRTFADQPAVASGISKGRAVLVGCTTVLVAVERYSRHGPRLLLFVRSAELSAWRRTSAVRRKMALRRRRERFRDGRDACLPDHLAGGLA